MGVATQDTIESDIEPVSSCQDSCGIYLSIFANLSQFYLIATLIMLLHKYARRSTYLLISLLIILSTLSIQYIVQDKGIKAFLFYDDNYMRYLVYRPWFRLPSFLTGLLLGLIISRIHSARYIISFSFGK
jgi:hypothetical protein